MGFPWSHSASHLKAFLGMASMSTFACQLSKQLARTPAEQGHSGTLDQAGRTGVDSLQTRQRTPIAPTTRNPVRCRCLHSHHCRDLGKLPKGSTNHTSSSAFSLPKGSAHPVSFQVDDTAGLLDQDQAEDVRKF